jgi:hypothetical protein
MKKMSVLLLMASLFLLIPGRAHSVSPKLPKAQADSTWKVDGLRGEYAGHRMAQELEVVQWIACRG